MFGIQENQSQQGRQFQPRLGPNPKQGTDKHQQVSKSHETSNRIKTSPKRLRPKASRGSGQRSGEPVRYVARARFKLKRSVDQTRALPNRSMKPGHGPGPGFVHLGSYACERCVMSGLEGLFHSSFRAYFGLPLPWPAFALF